MVLYVPNSVLILFNIVGLSGEGLRNINRSTVDEVVEEGIR